jgi:hypothetical protein
MPDEDMDRNELLGPREAIYALKLHLEETAYAD